MENSPKPTILVIPGAWFPSSTYQPLLDVLEKAGFPTMYSRLTSLNPPDPSTTSIAADAAAIREKALLPLIEDQGKEVVLVMHSYGSLPGGAAAIGLGVKERKRQGKKGGVLGLIPITAFVIPENTSMEDGLGGQFPDWLLMDDVSSQCSLIPTPANQYTSNSRGLVSAGVKTLLIISHTTSIHHWSKRIWTRWSHIHWQLSSQLRHH